MDYAREERQAFLKTGKRIVSRQEKVSAAIKAMGNKWVLHPQHKPNKKSTPVLVNVPNLAHGHAIECYNASMSAGLKQIIGLAMR